MMKKKMMILLTSFLMLLSVTACSGGGKAQQSGVSDPSTADSAQSTNQGGSDKNGSATIVLSMFAPSEQLQEAKKKYEQLHPNITIKLEDVKTDDAHLDADMEKYLTTTNTAMLAGKGPDVLIMDHLPVKNYVKNQLLVNLDTLIEKDSSFKKDDYFTNILDNAKINGGLYQIPLTFWLDFLRGDEDGIAKAGVTIDDKTWSWNDFTEISKKLVTGGAYPYVLPVDAGSMLNLMVNDNYSQFVDEAGGKAHFDSGAFTELLQQVKKMSDDHIIGPGDSYFFPAQFRSPGEFIATLNDYETKNMKLYMKPHATDVPAGGFFEPYLMVGLNAKSEVKEQAWDFIKFLMSDNSSKSYFPISKKVYAEQIAQLKKVGKTEMVNADGVLEDVSVKIDDAQLDQLESYLTGATHIVYSSESAKNSSNKIAGIIFKECDAFFSGQKSAEEVAGLIQNKVTTYLNE